jgi:hypothetical protein
MAAVSELVGVQPAMASMPRTAVLAPMRRSNVRRVCWAAGGVGRYWSSVMVLLLKAV